MGLGISVGQLAYLRKHDDEGAAWLRDDLAALNEVLVANGLPAHVEPEELELRLLPHVSSFPYSFIHYLRRAFSHTRRGRPPFSPAPSSFDPMTDPFLDEELTLYMDSHLCCHSDASGFYVPIDFPDVLYGDALPGGMAGSSFSLMRELVRTAPVLGIELVDGTIDERTAGTLANADERDPLYRERIVWGALFAAAKASIEHRTLIVFG